MTGGKWHHFPPVVFFPGIILEPESAIIVMMILQMSAQQKRLSRYLVGAPMPQDRFYNSLLNIYRAVSFKTRIWTDWTDYVAW